MDWIASRLPAVREIAKQRNRIKGAAGAFVLVLAASAAPLAQSRSAIDELNDVPVEYLKRIYLACAGAAVDGQLDNAGIMQCSVAYEVLKERAFGGDFLKLLAWSQAHPVARSASQLSGMSDESQ